MIVYCPTCRDYTLLNDKRICLWCDHTIPERNILAAQKKQEKQK